MPSKSPSPSPLFPTYLVPSLPFRRRKSSTDSTGSSFLSSSPTDTAGTSPPTAPTYLSGHSSHLRCARCASDLALSNQIISKGFQGRHGRAYLVAPPPGAVANTSTSARAPPNVRKDTLPNLPNTYTHKPVLRQLVTGPHTVGDISCAVCGSGLGWKYIAAEDESQKYKVGKFILETKKVCRDAVWDGEEGSGGVRVRTMPPSELPGVEEEVEFDSQDEDECEDLFMGVYVYFHHLKNVTTNTTVNSWTPHFALKRRRAKCFARDADFD